MEQLYTCCNYPACIMGVSFITGGAAAILRSAVTFSFLLISKCLGYKNNTINKDKPVFIHVYDYPTPRNAPAKLFEYFKKGPWLFKAFNKMGVDLRFRQQISDHIFNQLAMTILQFDGRNHISVIDTRNTLTRANAGDVGNSNCVFWRT